MSASYGRSSRSSWSSGYDSRAYGLGGSSSTSTSSLSSSLYGSGGSSYGRSSGIGGSSSGSSRYSSGLDSLSSSRDYRSSRSYRSSVDSPSTSYSSRSSYQSSSSRPGYIPSTTTSSYDSSSRRRTSLTDASKAHEDFSSERKSSVDIQKDSSDSRNRSRLSSQNDDTSIGSSVKNDDSSFGARRSFRRNRRNERTDSEGANEVEPERTSSITQSQEKNQIDSSRLTSNDSGERSDNEKYPKRNYSTHSNRFGSWSSSTRYSRDAETSEEPQKGNRNFDRKLASYVKDCDDQMLPRPSNEEQSPADSLRDGGNCTANGNDDVWENDVESQTTLRSSKVTSHLASSSSPFDKREGVSLTCSGNYRRDDQLLDVSPDANQRSKLVNGTAKITAKTASTTASSSKRINNSSSSNLNQSKTANEVVRLESLCEARTKELTHTKMQLKATGQAFDAMSVLVNYCCTELDAFRCPELAQKLETVQKQLTDCLAEIGELTSQKETLTENLTQTIKEKEEETKRAEEAIATSHSEKEEHQRVQKEMDTTHNAALTAQRDELTTKHEDQSRRMKENQDEDKKHFKENWDRKISALINEHKLEFSTLRLSHLEQIEALRAKHDSQMEELHKQHRNKLEDITHRFESIKVTLSEKVESLRGECDDLRVRARSSEEALQKDADVKVQMALAPFISLPKEIESLRTVLEMRNEEVQKLRSRNMDLEKQLEEIPIAREKIISLHQKVENLEAIINIKTDHEKQMHEKCQVLMRKYDRESRANKRLSMDYEQIMWRMSQSEYGSTESLTKRQLSRSPPRSETTSPDPRRRHRSPHSTSDVTLRVKKRSSNSESDGERKLRSRSATFVLEKEEGKQEKESSPSSTQSTPRHLKKKRELQGNQQKAEDVNENADHRMCHSAGAELITAALEGSKQTWIVSMADSQSSEMNDEGMESLPMGSSVEMAASYARSISGVSDSGVYDSMTRSDMLNSSIISTDSEWMASTHASMTLDSTNDDDYNSFMSDGQKVTSSNTVLDMSKFQGDPSHTEYSHCSSSISSNDATVNEKDHPQDISCFEFQLNLTAGSEDEVFGDKVAILNDSTERTNVESSLNTTYNMEASISQNASAISSNQQSQPP